MNEDKLKIILLFKAFFVEIIEILIPCNRSYLELKKIVLYECNTYLKDLYIANDCKDINSRIKKKEELVIRLKHISSLLQILYQLKLIPHKKYLRLGNDLEVILRLMSGWKNK